MTLSTPPARRPSRRALVGIRVGAILGFLIMAGFLVSWLAANVSSVKIDYNQPYTWRSGSAIYLSNLHPRPVTCTVLGPDGRQDVVELPEDRWQYSVMQLHGARLDRTFDGAATISCDRSVTVSSGPVLWLYPIASTFVVPLVGIVLVAAWTYYDRHWSIYRGPDMVLGLAWLIGRLRRRGRRGRRGGRS